MSGVHRIGGVHYLNAQPLLHGLGNSDTGIELHLDHPSRLADALARSELDVALVPSIEYLRGQSKGYRIVPGLAIAARGPVQSVKLFSRVPIRSIDRLALDEGSRTSHVLARIWLSEAHGVHPTRIEALPLGVSPLESLADAVLVIGDRAMRVPPQAFAHVIDLADAWFNLTGMPFVFALWVARAGVEAASLVETLHDCKASGLAHAAEIAADYGPRLGIEPEICLHYLTRVLTYDLGAPEIAGLRLFAAKAAAIGQAPRGVDLVFLEHGHNFASRH